jgi:molybdate transport system substrate-binding protein
LKPKATLALFLLILFGTILPGCGTAKPHGSGTDSPEKPVELYVLAAASLSDAINEAKPLYEASHPGVKLLTVFGSSGSLQKQLEQGAPADLFISAATKQMKALAEKQLIDLSTNLLANELVVIVPKNSSVPIQQLQDLQQESVKKLAIGQPETVPAGTYAEQALTHLGIWDEVQQKAVFAKDVRQVLTYVETGNVDAGIVYKTDALSSDQVRIVATASPDSHEPIVYPVAVVKATEHKNETVELYHWLQSEEAAEIFKKYGFQTVRK